MIYNDSSGIFISVAELQLINHKLIEGIQCQEYSDSLEIEYEHLTYVFIMQGQLVEEKNKQLGMQEQEKKRLRWWAVTSSIGAGILLILHFI